MKSKLLRSVHAIFEPSWWQPLLMSIVALMTSGCATAPEQRVVIQKVNVPIPVECKEVEPQRPLMPTESLEEGVTVYQFVKASQAEIKRREGYEIQLRAALAICTAPIKSNQPDAGTTGRK